MNDLTPDKVAEIAGMALESMAFMVMDPVDTNDEHDVQFRTAITYNNDLEDSELFLSASEGFTIELASALLGIDIDEVDPNEDGSMALSELTNILAGEVGRVLGAETSLFDVGIPKLIVDLPDASTDARVVECLLDTMGDSLHVLIYRTAKG
ncbi:MAG: hypothetical protein ACI8QC_004043 [Planctomycetota bacterium]